jgi:hypothetical protein
MLIGRYINNLKNGKHVTFREFTLNCAQDFVVGVPTKMFSHLLSNSRVEFLFDNPLHPDNYHLDAVETAKKRLAEVEKWSSVLAEREAKKAFDKKVRSIHEVNEKNEPIRLTCIVMLKEVRKWVPPTRDHEKLKNFMVIELAEAIESFTSEMPEPISGRQYRKQLMDKAHQNIVYHTKMHAGNVQGARNNRDWVCALRRSLKRAK